MTLFRTDERLAAMAMPELVRDPALELGAEDTIVLCAGFEDRSIAWLKRLAEGGSRAFTALVLDYLPAVPQNRGAEVEALVARAGATIERITYSRTDPTGAGLRILERIRTRSGRWCLDISGMSRLLIVQAIAAALDARERMPHVLYAEAAEYPPSKAEFDEGISLAEADPVAAAMFLSSGVFDICVVPELSTVAMAGQPIRVVAFPSFNSDQMAALRSEIQAASWTIIHGIPRLAENSWREEALAKLNRIEGMPGRQDLRASTLDYRETLRLLLAIYRDHGVLERIVVAPTGSKMQAVAVGVFRGALSDIQIVYPTPKQFLDPARFTVGVDGYYACDLGVLRSLDQVASQDPES